MPTATLTHVGALVDRHLPAYASWLSARRAWKALAAYVGLWVLTRVVTPESANINLAFHVHPGWERPFSSYPVYFATLLAAGTLDVRDRGAGVPAHSAERRLPAGRRMSDYRGAVRAARRSRVRQAAGHARLRPCLHARGRHVRVGRPGTPVSRPARRVRQRQHRAQPPAAARTLACVPRRAAAESEPHGPGSLRRTSSPWRSPAPRARRWRCRSFPRAAPKPSKPPSSCHAPRRGGRGSCSAKAHTTASVSARCRSAARNGCAPRSSPLLPGCTAVPFGDIDLLARALAGGDAAAFLVEPVQIEGGVHFAPPGYLRAARELCYETRHAARARRSADRLRPDGIDVRVPARRRRRRTC